MAGLDDLIAAFTAQTNDALNAPAAPWQQELLETVNPEKVKRQNIARALAKASTALATTPGNFLEGVSAAASQGADSYITGRDEAEQERMKVQQLLGMQAQKDQDRRLQLLLDAVGVQRNIQSDERAAKQDERQAKESDARTNYYNRRGTNSSSGLSAAQIETNRRYVDRALKSYEANVRSTGYDLSEDEIQQKVADERARMEEEFGLLGGQTSAQNPSAEVVQPGKTDQIVTKNSGAKKGGVPPDILQQAKDAIAKGADPAAVRQRLIDNGYDVSGF